jgi:hypothetical protein
VFVGIGSEHGLTLAEIRADIPYQFWILLQKLRNKLRLGSRCTIDLLAMVLIVRQG